MSVFGLLGTVGSFIKAKSLYDSAVVDNIVFRLHYRFTSAFFFGACIVITAFDLFGKPIDCVTTNFERMDLLNTHCWISGSYTFFPNSLSANTGGSQQDSFGSSLGIGPDTPYTKKRYHSYYQWVPFMLFLQGVLFYLPHRIWKTYEGGRIKHMTEGFRGPQLLGADDAKRQERRSLLYDYFVDFIRQHSSLVYVYVVCELLNFVNVVGNIYFIDKFLGGYFLEYGTKVLSFSLMEQKERNDPMIETFPRIVKCSWEQYGFSGSVEKRDALCLIPLNVANEKIYIFVWFWLIFVSVVSALAILYRTIMFASTTVRRFVFNFCAPSDKDSTDMVVSKLSLGDYFILNLLAKNLEGVLFRGLMDDLASHLSNFPIKQHAFPVRSLGFRGLKRKVEIDGAKYDGKTDPHVAVYVPAEGEVKFS